MEAGRLAEILSRISRFWQWRRMALVAELRTYIVGLQEQIQESQGLRAMLERKLTERAQEVKNLTDQCYGLARQMEAADEELAEEKIRHARTSALYDEQGRGLQQAVAQLKLAKSKIQALERRYAAAAGKAYELAQRVVDQGGELEERQRRVGVLEGEIEEVRVSCAALQEENEYMKEQYPFLGEKLGLMEAVLSSRPPANGALCHFQKIMKEEITPFVTGGVTCAPSAAFLHALSGIQRELERVAAFPDILGRAVIAIAGGFSSGKSQFINSFLAHSEILLPVGINPVTAVPGYVICAKETYVKAHSVDGGSVRLSEKLYRSLGHEMLQSLGFDLRGIMPFLSVHAPMDRDLFENLCLIDTPGYNPGDSDIVIASDNAVAAELAGRAQAMIWVIGLDTAGTIARSDVDFIRTAGFQGESLYIVLNKADLKSPASIEEIVRTVAESLEAEGLDVAGICAYSSRKKATYKYKGAALKSFLRSYNYQQDVWKAVEKGIDRAFGQYEEFIQQEMDLGKARRRQVRRLESKVLEMGGTELHGEIKEACESIRSAFNVVGLRGAVEECEKFRGMLKVSVRQIRRDLIALSGCAPPACD